MKANSKRLLSITIFIIGFSLVIYQLISLFFLNNPSNPIIGSAVNQYNPLLTIIAIVMGLIGGLTGGNIFGIIFKRIKPRKQILS